MKFGGNEMKRQPKFRGKSRAQDPVVLVAQDSHFNVILCDPHVFRLIYKVQNISEVFLEIIIGIGSASVRGG